MTNNSSARAFPALAAHGVALLAIALAVLATRGIWFGDPVADFDEQLYSFIGWRMQFGELPFIDWWDRKPFGLFAIYGAAHAIFGPEALAYQIVAAAFAMASGWLVYDLARLLVDRFTAAMAGIITVMLLAAYGSYSGQSEIFFAPLMLGMVRLLASPTGPNFSRRAALAMLLGGLALQVKYTVIPQCLFLGLYALWVEQRAGTSWPKLAARGALYAGLGLLPTLLIAGFYAANGGFDAFVFANFISFFDRLPASQDRWIYQNALNIAPLVFLTLGGIYAAWRMHPPANRALYLLYCGWAASALGSVMLPDTIYLYYCAALVPPIALVSLPLLDRKGPTRGILAVLLAVGFAALLSLPQRHAQSLEEREAAASLARAIAPHTDDQQNCLWLFDGPTALYRLSGSCAPSRFVYPDHLNNALEEHALEVDQAQEVTRILATRPGVIVTASRPVTPQNPKATALVQNALAADYEKLETAEMHGRTLLAWKRRD